MTAKDVKLTEHKSTESETENNEEKIDFQQLFTYIGTEKGHEIISRTLAIFEDIKKAKLDKEEKHLRFATGYQIAIIILIILASSILTYFSKFDSTIGFLFGTLIGYLFGKK